MMRIKVAPNSPMPTVNIPATPPARKAIRTRSAEARLSRRVRGPDVRAHGEPHPHVPGDHRRERAEQERDRPPEPDADRAVLGVLRHRKHEEQHDCEHREEHRERPVLTVQVRLRALLDRPSDLLHLLRALGRREHLAHQVPGEEQCDERDAEDEPQGQVLARPEPRLDRAALLGKPADHRTSYVWEPDFIRTGACRAGRWNRRGYPSVRSADLRRPDPVSPRAEPIARRPSVPAEHAPRE